MQKLARNNVAFDSGCLVCVILETMNEVNILLFETGVCASSCVTIQKTMLSRRCANNFFSFSFSNPQINP